MYIYLSADFSGTFKSFNETAEEPDADYQLYDDVGVAFNVLDYHLLD